MANNSGIINKIKNRITNIFKPKPKTYLLGDGKTLEINGSISNPRNPISTFLNSIGTSLVDFTSSIKKHIDDSKIKNTPIVHSTSLVESKTKTSSKEDPGLLSQGNIENTHIIPHNVKTTPSSTPKRTILNFKEQHEQLTPRVYTATMSFKGHKISDSIKTYNIENIEAIKAYRETIIRKNQAPEIPIKHKESKEI